MTPEQIEKTVDPVVASLGAAFYFAPETLAQGREIGLDGMRLYFLGRGGVLGDVEPAVVHSAFGYFAPGLVAKMWDTARQRTALTPRQVGRLYLECAGEHGRRRFAAVAGLDKFCSAADRVLEVTDPAGLALYAGWAAEPLAGDPAGRAMQLLAVLRELRGSVHLVAVVASGLEPRVAHYIRRPAAFQTFGYAEEDEPRVGDAERRALAEADACTDRLMAAIYGRLTDAQQADLAAGVGRLAAEAGPGSE
jgi:hypothetical protein